MGESLNQQDVVLDTIDEKVTKPHLFGNEPKAPEAMHCAIGTVSLLLHNFDILCQLQMNKVTEQLKTNNMKLKGMLTQVVHHSLQPV